MSKKVTSIVPCPEDLQAVFSSGFFETPLCLGLLASGEVVPMLLDAHGAVTPATDLDGYRGLFREEDVDEVVASLTHPLTPTVTK